MKVPAPETGALTRKEEGTSMQAFASVPGAPTQHEECASMKILAGKFADCAADNVSIGVAQRCGDSEGVVMKVGSRREGAYSSAY